MLSVFASCYPQFFLLFLLLQKKVRVKRAPAIPTGAPTTLTEEITQTLPLVTLKTMKILTLLSKAATCLLNFYCIIFFDLFLR